MPSVTIPLEQSDYEALGRTAQRLGHVTSSGRGNVRSAARALIQEGIKPDLKPSRKKGAKP